MVKFEVNFSEIPIKDETKRRFPLDDLMLVDEAT